LAKDGNAADKKLELLWARMESLVLAAVDMVDVIETCRYLLDEHPEAKGHGAALPWRIRRTLETGMFVTYARPFVRSRRGGHLNRSRDLNGESRKDHDDILVRRDQVYAHTDRTDLRRIIEFDNPEARARWLEEFGDLKENWFPPTREGLTTTIALAEAHLKSVLEELGKLRQRIIE
jgi:hypothetical protein